MRTGDEVPDFSATTDTGDEITLSKLTAEGPVVLFFYPKAFTLGCTAQACHFRDLATEFAAVGATPVGVSRDDVETQRAFGAEHDLGYSLLADEDGAIAALFGAKRLGPLWSKRQTFVIAEDRTLLGRITSEADMDVHADDALALLRAR